MNAATYAPEVMERMRSVGWKIGQTFNASPPGRYLAFSPIKSGLAYLHWDLTRESIAEVQQEEGDAFDGAQQTLRLYDVSWIEFNGTNAHSFFDIYVDGLWGRYYWKTDRIERFFLAEIGFRLRDGRYRALARSEVVFMDRAHRSHESSNRGMYVGGRFERVKPIENIFDASTYARIHHSWSGSLAEDLEIAYFADEPQPEAAARLKEYLDKLHGAAGPLGVHFHAGESAPAKVHLVHAHDIDSSPAAAKLAKKAKAPLVLSVHASERERAELRGREIDEAKLRKEVQALKAADWVITAHSDTRNQIIADGLVSEDRVIILPDLFQGVLPKAFDPGDVKKRYHLNPARPMALFSGEISHAAGADLLVSAFEHVMGNNHEAQVVFAGNGPLRDELQRRAHESGHGERIRFIGHVGREHFMELLAACDFVAIPARTWQDESLAHLALENGKSVLATHQARIGCVNHGQNGLMVYDNPGSLIWGLNEMFNNPMNRGYSHQGAGQPQSLESLAVELCVFYNNILNNAKEGATDA